MDARKRWVAIAHRNDAGWRLSLPSPVGDVGNFLDRLLQQADGGAVALGVDLPLGLPRAFAAQRSEPDFPAFLRGVVRIPEFFQVCAHLDELGPNRPFYPARGIKGMTRASHAERLGFGSAAGLSRDCDRATAERPAGAPLFWTLGANQTGKAAIAAWRDMLLPAFAKNTPLRLWPFEGPFLSLLTPGTIALAETYPAEALRHLGIRLVGSKRRQSDRARVADGLFTAMTALNAKPEPALTELVRNGCGADAAGEDRFDCLLGVLCVLNVLAGNRPDKIPAKIPATIPVTAPIAALNDCWIERWEGWVLGQTALPAEPARPACPQTGPNGVRAAIRQRTVASESRYRGQPD